MYKCECGKEFEKPNSFNAHKSNCRDHYIAKYGSDEKWLEIKDRRSKNSLSTNTVNFKQRQVEELNIWISEQHICERCHKIMTKRYGSGRFCSQSCANSHKHSDHSKQNIRAGVMKKTICNCLFCDKVFTNLTAKASHERLCRNNPEVIIIGDKIATASLRAKLERKYKIDTNTELDVTYAEVKSYLETHLTCEICGKTVEEAVKWKSENAPKRLCIDHDHSTLKFRGVLCSVCNRQLGWYEANKEAINKYLEKDFPLEDKSK